MGTKIHIFIITTLILAGAYAKVGSNRGLPPKFPVHKDDIIEFDLSRVFDLSNADMDTLKFEVSQQADKETPTPIPNQVYSRRIPFRFDNTFKADYHVNTIKFIDNTTHVIITDDRTIHYRRSSSDGFSPIPKESWTTEVLKGTQYLCQDAVASKNGKSIYIGCVSPGATEAQPGSLYMVVIDRLTGTVGKITQTDFKDEGFFIRNRVMIGTYTLPQGKVDAEFVVVYDQGISIQTVQRKQAKFLVYQDISSELHFDGFMDIKTPEGDAFTAIYDIMNYDDILVVTGRTEKTSSNIMVSGCTFDLTAEAATCGTKYDTGVSNGFVVIMNTGQMSSYDYTTDVVSVYDLNGAFASKGWATLAYKHAVKHTDVSESTWIRRYEGNEHAAIFQWANNNGIDTGFTVVSWTMDVSYYTSGSTAIVLREIMVAADNSGSAYYRLTNPFFIGHGFQFDGRFTNNLIIKASDKETATPVIATSNLFNLGTARVNVKFDQDSYSKGMYTDVFAGSTFKVPFFFEDWLEGNGVDWRVVYDQSKLKSRAFELTEVITEFQPVVNFSPPRPINNFRKVAFTQGGLVAQDLSGILYFYACTYPDRHTINCYQKFSTPAGADSYLNREVHLIGDFVFAYTTNGKTKIGTTVWVVSLSEGVTRHDFDFVTESVTFTSDQHHTLIAVAQNTKGDAKSGTVHVFSQIHDLLSSWSKIRTINAGTVGLDYFCPWQIRPEGSPDTTKIHILSACPALQQVGETRIVAISVDTQGAVQHDGLVLPEITGIPSFCPMNDHYVIADTNSKNFIWVVDNFQSWARYNKYLSDFGYKQIETLECFPYAQQYSVIGNSGDTPRSKGSQSNAAPDQIYTLFWGHHKYNNLKFVNYLNKGLDTQKWNGLESYQLEDYVVHVGYPSFSFVNFAATLNRPPEIKTRVAYVQEAMDDTVVNYNITGYIGMMQNSLSSQVTLRKPHEEILYNVINRWDGEEGWLDLEHFTEVWGPVTTASMAGYIQNVTFVDRKRRKGGLPAGDNPMYFDQFRGSYHKGIGLQATSELAQFALVQESEIVGYSSAYRVINFDCSFKQIDGPRSEAIILYQASETSGRYVAAFSFGPDSKKHAPSNIIKINGDKIRIGSIGDNTNYLGFVLDTENHIMRFVSIKYDNVDQPPQIALIDNVMIHDVWDFDTIPQDGKIQLFMIKSGSSVIYDLPVTFTGGKWVFTHDTTEIQPDPKRKYWLRQIAANTDGTTNFIAASTYGTVIFAIDQVAKTPSTYQVVQTLDKYEDYEGTSLFIDDQFVVQRANRLTPPVDTSVLVWRTRTRDNTIHTAIDLSGYLPGPRGERVSQEVGKTVDYPITLFTNQNGDHIVAIGGQSDQFPLAYWEIHNFGIHIPENSGDLDFSTLDIVFQGTQSSKVTLDQMLSGTTPGPHPDPVPPGKTFQWWPFMIILGVLILAAIAWFLYARSKQEPVEDDEYFSMQQKTKITDANEVEEGLEDEAGLEGLEDEGLN